MIRKSMPSGCDPGVGPGFPKDHAQTKRWSEMMIRRKVIALATDAASRASSAHRRYAAENISTNALTVPATLSSDTCQAAPSSAA